MWRKDSIKICLQKNCLLFSSNLPAHELLCSGQARLNEAVGQLWRRRGYLLLRYLTLTGVSNPVRVGGLRETSRPSSPPPAHCDCD